MDPVDEAKVLERGHRKAALDAALNTPEKDPDDEQILNDEGQVICIDCKNIIPSERVDIRPEAVRCAFCKITWEKNRKMGVTK